MGIAVLTPAVTLPPSHVTLAHLTAQPTGEEEAITNLCRALSRGRSFLMVTLLTALLGAGAAHVASAAGVLGEAESDLAGRTSQKLPISMKLAGATVTGLRYQIEDRCPGGRRLRIRAWGFPPLAIKASRFNGKFTAEPPHSATSTISGEVSGQTISGSLLDRTRSPKTHRICTGRATFRLRPR